MLAKHLLCRVAALGALGLALAVTARSASAQTNTLTVGPDIATTVMGLGTVTSVPAGINCTVQDVGIGPAGTSGTCSAQFSSLISVTLLATPGDPGVAFTSWGGACAGSGGCSVNMSQPRSVSVKFTPTTNYTLTVQMSGNGTASVRASSDKGSPAIGCFISIGVVSGTCTTQYPATARAALEFVPSANAAYLPGGGFTGLCTGTDLCFIRMTGSKSVGVTVRAPTIEIQRAGGSGSGTISGNGASGCSISPSGASGAGCLVTYPAPSVQTATLVATPGANSTFGGYSGPCTGMTCTVGAGSNVVVGVTFNLQTYPISVTGTGGGSGTVTSSPGGVNCSINAGSAAGTCSPLFDYGTSVTLSPNAAPGSRFAGWSNACTGTGACVLSTTVPRNVTARFEVAPPRVIVSGSGSGTVTSQPLGINCSFTASSATGQCDTEFSSGATVSLSATPSPGWRFSGWSGACSGASTCQLSLSQDRTVTATFLPLPVTLTVIGTGTGSGTVSSQPGDVACTISGNGASGKCESSFEVGTNVTLTADAGPASTFDGWSAPCGIATTCQVTMTQARTVTAKFTGTLVALRLAAGGTGDGTVSSNVGGMNCTITAGKLDQPGCSAGVAPGSAVTLTAASRNGSTFGGWTGCSATQKTCIVQVPQAGAQVTAQFTAPRPIAELAAVLLGGATLTADEITALDDAGNKNQRFDLGDLLAAIDRAPAPISPATLSAIAERERQRQSASPKPRRVP